MGPSGAGKTTFLSTLLGKAHYGNLCGSITINGRERGIADYRTVVGFVPQDDIMWRTLKVREVLQYQAKLRLPREWSRERRMGYVQAADSFYLFARERVVASANAIRGSSSELIQMLRCAHAGESPK